jgi:hypothetical protein
LSFQGPLLLAGFLILGGIQHFVYADFVARLVPAWIPGSHFWVYLPAWPDRGWACSSRERPGWWRWGFFTPAAAPRRALQGGAGGEQEVGVGVAQLAGRRLGVGRHHLLAAQPRVLYFQRKE